MLAEMIKKLRKEQGLSQRELAKALNVHQTAVSQWENKRTRPDQEVLQNMALLFNVSVDYLLGINKSKAVRMAGAKSMRIPVFGSIPAGIPLSAIQDVEEFEELSINEYSIDKEYFALKIHGDSMYPMYLDGDVVIFAAQETCESGQDCAVIINGDNATFKRVRISEQGITLQPLNPAYEPILLSTIDLDAIPVRIIGVAKEIRRKI